jgi:hypothetical protein
MIEVIDNKSKKTKKIMSTITNIQAEATAAEQKALAWAKKLVAEIKATLPAAHHGHIDNTVANFPAHEPHIVAAEAPAQAPAEAAAPAATASASEAEAPVEAAAAPAAAVEAATPAADETPAPAA